MSNIPLRSRLRDRLEAGVLIQGEEYSFHHRAAGLLLGEVEVVPCVSFPKLAVALEAAPERLGLMAIENSVAGAILQNYLLLEAHGLHIVGEVYLRISHAVMTVRGAEVSAIERIESHPMALAQCRNYFNERPGVRPVEAYDTAGSALAVAHAGDPARAALAPVWCAEVYDLEVVEQAVEDNPHNWTRFVLVDAHAPGERGAKTSVAFNVHHRSGALAEVLTRLATSGCQLTKIQSLPQVGKPWEYRFFADFLLDDDARRHTVLELLADLTTGLTHLGTYEPGKHHEP